MTIDEICRKYGITNYIINDDGTIDVNGNVWLNNRDLVEFPLTFNRVSGYFNCGSNELTSLKGCPKWVGGYFSCGGNRLTSLEFSPEYVGDDFNCSYNELTTLKGSSTHVGGHFRCGDNLLTSLEFSPDYIEMDFLCNDNRLTSLVGSPKHVGGDFVCSDNEDLNNITGCTEKIGKYFFCNDTLLHSIFNVVDRHFLYTFNFYKIIKEDTVNLKRLKYVMDLYDKRIDLEEIQKYYKII
jgi:hypothetical protein